jgi:hypothetical protein
MRNWSFSLVSLLGRHYRDFAAVAFLLFVYPQLTNESHFSEESAYWNWLSGFCLFMGILGAMANVIKLRTLDSEIHGKKLQALVKAPILRFLSGLIALPLLITIPIVFLLRTNDPPSWIGGIFMGTGVVLWMFFFNVGIGAARPAPCKGTVITVNVLLIFYELFIYTIFLESLWMGEVVDVQSLSVLFILAVPMALLFCMLFLPATVGFYIEAVVGYGSHWRAFFVLLYRFMVFRYLPVFGLVYLEQQEIRLPWVS